MMNLIQKVFGIGILLLTGAAQAAEPVPVVVSHSILADWVTQVGGDSVAVRVLVGRDADAHTFAPTPADAAALTRAVVIFENGLGFEPWLDRLVAASQTKARRVVVTRGIRPLRPELEHNHAGHGPGAHGEHAHGDVNPHFWHDPRLAQVAVETIRASLVEADPARAAEYQRRAETYTKELAVLDAWIAEQTAKLPAARRKIVTSHDTFAYFAKRYGFVVLGTALGSFTTDVPDPSARELAALIQKVKAAGVPAVFCENMVNPKVVRQLAREAGVKLAPVLYTDALGPAESTAGSYLKLMRSNTATIVAALGSAE
ncbi:MAG: Periplasmic chelated iron-binding protein YfeA [Verrucomicrobiae bacterium]|nr:Periplasmic chelated iron-binding protein YfeA [Verrucomicrobiae bacterium]